MNTSAPCKKYKRPKQKTLSTTKPESSKPSQNKCYKKNESKASPCHLLAKDSEWVDIQSPVQAEPSSSIRQVSEEEAELQLVECEDGPQMKPLAIMFPSLLEGDAQTLEGILNKAMSTTEVTRHLVDLGEKANFVGMRKANRLIPPDKKWLQSVTENSNSHSSLQSGKLGSSFSSDYEADTEIADSKLKNMRKKKKKGVPTRD